jgi:hypothetical protein
MSLASIHASCLVVFLTLLTACAPQETPLRPLTEAGLAAAERQWESHGANSYQIVVRLHSARMGGVVYDVVVHARRVTSIKRDGQDILPEHTEDYSVVGLFRLLQQELHLVERHPSGTPNTLAVLSVHFDPGTGRLERYRRKTLKRAGGLRIEVLKFIPQATG